MAVRCDQNRDVWCHAAEKAVEAGLVVVVAAGNEGPDKGSVDSPGIDPEVITVGNLDDRKSLDTKQHTVDDTSSRGPTAWDGVEKPDVVAPGVRLFGPLVPHSKYDHPEIPHIGHDYVAITGTSQATPLVSCVGCHGPP